MDGPPERLAEVLGLAACLLIKNLAWYSVVNRARRHRRDSDVSEISDVGRIERIVVYPVKSCRGVELSRADIADGGLVAPGGVRDRSYLVLSETDGGRFVSLKAFPQLSVIQPLLDPDRPGSILLAAEGHPTVRVTPTLRQVPVTFRTEALTGLDCGDEVATWLSRVCDGRVGLRLVHCPSGERDSVRQRLRQLGLTEEAPDNRVAFADASPILLLSDKSLQALNHRLTKAGQQTTDWRNFRPNLMVGGVSREHEEDDWGSVRIGDCGDDCAQLAVVFQCERCAMVNLRYSQDGVASTPSGNPVLGELAPYRSRKPLFRGPLFGANCAVEAPGSVAIGDRVFASTTS